MMSRGVLEQRELRGASGDLWLAERDPYSLLPAGLTVYDTRLLPNTFSWAATTMRLVAVTNDEHDEYFCMLYKEIHTYM